MEQIKAAIRYFLSDGNTHTIEEVKEEISRLIGGEVMPGEVDSIFAELHRDTKYHKLLLTLMDLLPVGLRQFSFPR